MENGKYTRSSKRVDSIINWISKYLYWVSNIILFINHNQLNKFAKMQKDTYIPLLFGSMLTTFCK